MKVINLTSHDVTLLTDEGKFVIPPSGKVIRMEEVNVAEMKIKIEVGNTTVLIPLRERAFDVGKARSEIRDVVRDIRSLSNSNEPVVVVVSLPLLMQMGDEARRMRGEGIILVAPDTGATAKREKGQIVGVDGFVVISSPM